MKQNEVIKTKNELKEYAQLDKRIARIDEQLKENEQHITNARGQQFNGMPSSHNNSDLSDYIALKETLEDRKKTAVKRKVMIESKIAAIEDNTLAEILTLRFKNEMCWAEIAQSINKSESRTKALQKEAILAYSKAGK